MKNPRQELLDKLNDITGKDVGGAWGCDMTANGVMHALQDVAEVLKRVVKRLYPKDEEDDE